jgi:hypothetical protein
MTRSTCTVTRSKLYPTPGRSYRFAWKWIYTVTIPGEPYTFDGDTLGWVKSLCKSKAPGMPIVYAWKTEEESPVQKKTPAQLDKEIAAALDARIDKERDFALKNPRAVASDFPKGTQVSFVQRGHTVHGVSRGSDGGSELRLVIEDEDGLRWIVEAHKVKKQ